MNPNNQKDEFNPADKNYEETFKNLADEEVKKAGKSSQSSDSESGSIDDSANSVKDNEESGNGWYNPSGSGPQSGRGSFGGFVKNKGPIGLIVALVLGGGIGIGALFSPAILIVHLKETMVGKFNQQLGSMDARTMRLIDAKTKDATKGFCTTVKIKCKYSSMSERQLKKFRAAGIEIEVDKERPFGRSTIKSMSFNGQPISAGEFRAKMLSDPNFRSAVKKAYNPMFAGFADKTWTRVKGKFGISERAPSKSKDVEEKKKALHAASNAGDSSSSLKKAVANEPHPLCNPADKCTEADVEKVNGELDAEINAIKQLEPGNIKVGSALGSIRGTLAISGALDTACQAYAALQLTAFTAKNIRTIQLARYAMQYFTVADMIKAGDATPDDVSQLGTILTSTSSGLDANGNKRKSATDSSGYKYSAFGDSGSMSEYSSMFMAGGGLTGKFSGVSAFIDTTLGGRKNVKGTCRFLANPFVQAGSIIGGLAFTLTGVGVGKILLQAGLSVVVAAAISVLPNILADIIAGKVTEGIQGEDSGDAITSGAGALMGGVANIGGNAPLTKEQALAYNKLNQDTAVAYARDEALKLSPLDTSNRYTFLGSIAYSMMPLYTNSGFSLSTGLGSSLSILGIGINNLIPQAGAVGSAKEQAALDVCQDYDYKDIGIATDPFCNPIFGIPPQFLDIDPIEVVTNLYDKGYIDQDGLSTQKYDDWKAICTERQQAFGYNEVDSSSGIDDGKDCVINDKNTAYLFLGLIDSRIEDGMDGYDI